MCVCACVRVCGCVGVLVCMCVGKCVCLCIHKSQTDSELLTVEADFQETKFLN